MAKSIQIATALNAAGVPVELWFVRAAGKFRARIPAAISVIALNAGATDRKPQDDALYHVPAMARMIAARRPAVLLSGGKHFHLASRLALALSGRRRATAFGGRASNSSVRPGRRWLARQAARAAAWFKYAGMDFIIAVAPAIAEEVAGMIGARHVRIDIIPNGVDVELVRTLASQPVSHPWLDDPRGLPVIVSLGRIDHQKGFDILIRAVALARRERALRLLIIGGGDPSHLRALSADRGIASEVAFAGHLDNPFPYVPRCAAFVLASRWEGASNALIEALALGAPLVATDVGGSRDTLGNGRNGTLAPPADAAALAAAILLELDAGRDPDEQCAAGKRFSLETCMAAYVALLEQERARILRRS